MGNPLTRRKIRNVLYNLSKIEFWDEVGEKRVDKLLSLIDQHDDYLIGEDEPTIPVEPQNTFTQRMAHAKYQNDLRQEQRQRKLSNQNWPEDGKQCPKCWKFYSYDLNECPLHQEPDAAKEKGGDV